MKRPIRVAASLPSGFAQIAASQAIATTTQLFAEFQSANQQHLLPDDVAGQGLSDRWAAISSPAAWQHSCSTALRSRQSCSGLTAATM
jgi:hypothetical protein